ncbi:MAG: RloB domain-containing protein [Proteobacteria bacterium]|jgi:hypothetical protein|nr:RloB domain-containing protein [Pseudomonadota bacterium]MBK7115491.1 RloB domain-containing protein [Pseudomonadota bacterium]MBK9253496.1 RloB domain-containing protein [Pseudomonadota bacterium]MCC6630628.1 RloB domain-containing protein [Gammaproteobacteria bacterium]
MRDDHPRRRQKLKDAHRLARKKASRRGMLATLIICEGEETEPNYIRGLCDHLGINRAAVHIESGEGVTDPEGLVRKARKKFTSDGNFDRVFVVCDAGAGGLAEALKLAQNPVRNNAGETTNVVVVSSHPSFEFWLLLHFEYRASPCTAVEALRDLRRHLTNYEKSDPQVFQMVESGLEQACDRAQRLKHDLNRTGAASPDTDMAEFIRLLREMKQSADK